MHCQWQFATCLSGTCLTNLLRMPYADPCPLLTTIGDPKVLSSCALMVQLYSLVSPSPTFQLPAQMALTMHTPNQYH
jgi:hypothetical protein